MANIYVQIKEINLRKLVIRNIGEPVDVIRCNEVIPCNERNINETCYKIVINECVLTIPDEIFKKHYMEYNNYIKSALYKKRIKLNKQRKEILINLRKACKKLKSIVDEELGAYKYVPEQFQYDIRGESIDELLESLKEEYEKILDVTKQIASI